MRTRIGVALLVGLTVGLVGGLAGCGGSGGTPPEPTTSAIDGQVDIAGNVGDYELLLDGRPVPGALRADGSYSIEGVPPGEHRIAIVARDGMRGAYCTVEVDEGRRVRAPRVTPELGGQIVGIVTRHGDDGLRPLPGVEVTAQPAVVIAAEEAPGGDAQPEIWPPPELPTFSAFTDENGSYVIRAVPPGEYVVTVAQPQVRRNWQWVFVEAGHTAVADFELWPEVEPGVGTVRGRVVGLRDGSREPIVRARVTIITEEPWEPVGPPELPPTPPVGLTEEGREAGGEGACPTLPPDADTIVPPWIDTLSTLTDENGEYALNAPSGRASIEVWAPGWQSAWEEITILPGETLRQNFMLEPWDDELPQPGPPPMPLPPDDDLEPPAPPLPG